MSKFKSLADRADEVDNYDVEADEPDDEGEVDEVDDDVEVEEADNDDNEDNEANDIGKVDEAEDDGIEQDLVVGDSSTGQRVVQEDRVVDEGLVDQVFGDRLDQVAAIRVDQFDSARVDQAERFVDGDPVDQVDGERVDQVDAVRVDQADRVHAADRAIHEDRYEAGIDEEAVDDEADHEDVARACEAEAEAEHAGRERERAGDFRGQTSLRPLAQEEAAGAGSVSPGGVAEQDISRELRCDSVVARLIEFVCRELYDTRVGIQEIAGDLDGRLREFDYRLRAIDDTLRDLCGRLSDSAHGCGKRVRASGSPMGEDRSTQTETEADEEDKADDRFRRLESRVDAIDSAIQRLCTNVSNMQVVLRSYDNRM